MSDNTELNEAYTIVINAEKALVNDLVDLAKDFKDKIDAIKAKQPTQGSASAARQFLARVESNVNSVFTYDLDSVKSTYGMNTPVTMPAMPVLENTAA